MPFVFSCTGCGQLKISRLIGVQNLFTVSVNYPANQLLRLSPVQRMKVTAHPMFGTITPYANVVYVVRARGPLQYIVHGSTIKLAPKIHLSHGPSLSP